MARYFELFLPHSQNSCNHLQIFAMMQNLHLLWLFGQGLCEFPTSVHWLSYSSQGDNYHHAEVSESSSNPNQDMQNEKSATTSDVKSVLPKFSNINLLENDLVCGRVGFYWCFYYYMYCCWRLMLRSSNSTYCPFGQPFLICLFVAGPAWWPVSGGFSYKVIFMSRRSQLLHSDVHISCTQKCGLEDKAVEAMFPFPLAGLAWCFWWLSWVSNPLLSSFGPGS